MSGERGGGGGKMESKEEFQFSAHVDQLHTSTKYRHINQGKKLTCFELSWIIPEKERGYHYTELVTTNINFKRLSAQHHTQGNE